MTAEARGRTADDLEAAGMGPTQTQAPGTGGRFKVQDEDFVVEEIPCLPPPARGEGKWTVARVRSRGWETHHLVETVASRLWTSPERVHFAGTKDKHAVATRVLAVPVPQDRVRELSLEDVEVLETRRTDRAPKLGELVGNRFRVRLRDLDRPDRLEPKVEAVRDLGGVPNYFGPQRFGTMRPITDVVGEAIVEGDLESAVLAYVGDPQPDEPDDARRARRRLEADRDFEDARDWYPRRLEYERRLVEHVADEPGDWAGAIETLPRRLQLMFVYAYQSRLFNRVVAERLARDLPLGRPVPGDLVCDVDDRGFPDTDRLFHVHEDNLQAVAERTAQGKAWVTGPLFGTETPIARGEPGEVERSVREEAGRSPRDFVVPEIPHLTTTGTRRAVQAPVRDLEATRDGADATVAFTLPKGTYATCVLREIVA